MQMVDVRQYHLLDLRVYLKLLVVRIGIYLRLVGIMNSFVVI